MPTGNFPSTHGGDKERPKHEALPAPVMIIKLNWGTESMNTGGCANTATPSFLPTAGRRRYKSDLYT